MQSREELLARLKANPKIDVLIVGGGINGVGLLRDLASQGVGAVLVERGDLCSGTSAAPSRLIHGGLRYLETGEFALVRESVEERNRLMLNAPHLVVPLPVWVPLTSWWAGLARAPARFFGWTRTPGAKGAIVTKLGLVFYDFFGRRIGNVPRHRLVGGSAVRQAMPSIARSVKLAAEYYDARLVHPERLTLELADDAERDCAAAMALTYVELEANTGATVRLRDHCGGNDDGSMIEVRPALIVNTAGAWVDRVDGRLGVRKRLIGGTRGSHLVLRHRSLARELGPRMLYFETADHRVCLAYCIADDLVLLGTTDIRTDDPDDGCCTEAEIGYLLDVLRTAMPGTQVRRDQIVFSYAGVRPLPATDGLVAGAISRDHSVRVWPADAQRPYDILALVGGKWTTYRACAEQMADMVLARLGRARTTSTADLPIGTARDAPSTPASLKMRLADVQRAGGLDPAAAVRLHARYGCEALRVAEEISRCGGREIAGLAQYHEGEIRFVARHQRVTHLADVVLRRTLIAIEGRCTATGLQSLSDIVGNVLAWDAPRRAREREEVADILLRRHGVKLAQPFERAP